VKSTLLPNSGGEAIAAIMGETLDTTLSEQEYAVLLKILRKQNLKVTWLFTKLIDY